MLDINDIIFDAQMQGASDLHITAGLPIKCRIDGQIRSMSAQNLSSQDCEDLARQIAGAKADAISKIGELDIAITAACGARVRVNLYRSAGDIAIAVRILNDRIPAIEELGLPPVAETLPDYPNGIILVTGETGSGKSTTLASVLNRINQTRYEHIITLEDPIEYVYQPDKCVINQREIGKDTESYDDGLRAILREDPDVILIGEMRDLSTIESALTAAETGHLVFATLHTNSSVDSIDRIVSVFPEGRQRQIRIQLASTLKVVMSQQLLPMQEGGRVAACEVMVVNDAIRNLIREGKTPQMESFITMNSKEGSILMDNAVAKLLREGKITAEVAEKHMRTSKNVTKGSRY